MGEEDEESWFVANILNKPAEIDAILGDNSIPERVKNALLRLIGVNAGKDED